MENIKVKSLYDIAIERKIDNTEEFLKLIRGKKLKTIKSVNNHNSGHSYPKKFVVSNTSNGGWGSGSFVPTNSLAINNLIPNKTSSIYLSELAFDVTTKDELNEELKQLTENYNKQSEDLKEKLNLLEELGLNEYDEKIIKVVQVMGNFEVKKDSKLSKLDHAKLLVEALES